MTRVERATAFDSLPPQSNRWLVNTQQIHPSTIDLPQHHEAGAFTVLTQLEAHAVQSGLLVLRELVE